VSGPQEQIGANRSAKIKKEFSGWLIIIPAIILFAFFIWVPLVETLRLALYSTKGMDIENFVGLKNFRNVIIDPDFLPAVRNTFVYTIWSLVIGFLVPIIIAMFLNEVVHLKGLFRLGTYLPNVVPGLATVIMWSYILGSGSNGVLNIILHNVFGMGPTVWLSNPHIVIPLIVTTMTWKGAGATALIYLAGLQGINPELYEASAIDGAGIWKRIWHITVPNIYNLGRTLLILQIIAVFQILYEPLVMTNGGPNDASISLMQLVYNYAFVNFDYSKASAVSFIIAIMLFILTALYMKLSKPKDM
jgi:multiple sugar transport system permease protein